MNNAKMWLVVHPTVGVPIILGAVAVGSFSVHLAVVKNTTWVADFLSGKEMGSSHQMASAAVTAPDLNAAQAAYVLPTEDGAMEVTIILPDGTTTKGILQTSQVHAAAADVPLQITQ